MGLPLASFSQGGASNTCEFFQLRPDFRSGSSSSSSPYNEIEGNSKRMFSQTQYAQSDIARCCVASIAGPVAECITNANKESTGKSSGDVSTLYDLMNAVNPPLAPEKQQDHIRWSAVTAHEIITSNKAAYDKLCEKFAEGASLEDCVATVESAFAAGANV